MLAKQVQTELAQANAVADEVLATMTTVRAHAADDSAKAAYAVKLAKFYVLQVHLKYSATWHMCTLQKTGTEPQSNHKPIACDVCSACII